jgi:hypothetical protein
MSTRTTDDSLRIPEALQPQTDQIFKLTDPLCAEHLDAEYSELVPEARRQAGAQAPIAARAWRSSWRWLSPWPAPRRN